MDGEIDRRSVYLRKSQRNGKRRPENERVNTEVIPDREVRPLLNEYCEERRRVRVVRKDRFFFGFFILTLTALTLAGGLQTVSAAQFKTANFTVTATTPELAKRVAVCAEENRGRLALLWLGTPLRQWSSPCPIKVKAGPNLGAGGETSFTFKGNEVFGWKMSVQGTEERILDSVIPHEVSHMIFATYFRRPVPRWIDEGAATSMEADVERNNYRNMLIGFLQERKGLPFNTMVRLTEYPTDMMPFYSQGFSVCEYLIAVGGHRRLVEFARQGTASGDWSGAVNKFYGYQDLSDLQIRWTDWISEWHRGGHPAQLPAVAKVPEYRLDIYGREMGGTAVASTSIPQRGRENRGQPLAVAMNPSPAPISADDSRVGGPEILRPSSPLDSFAAHPSAMTTAALPSDDLYDSFHQGVGTAAPEAVSGRERLLASSNVTPSTAGASSEQGLRYQGSYGRRGDFSSVHELAQNEMARNAPPLGLTPAPLSPTPLRLGSESTILGQSPR